MGVGALRERVRFVRPTKTRRADGGYDVVQETVCERWASVVPVSAREDNQSGRMAPRTLYEITIRRTELLQAEDAVVWLTNGGMQMNIRELPLPSKRAAFLTIRAEAGAVL